MPGFEFDPEAFLAGIRSGRCPRKESAEPELPAEPVKPKLPAEAEKLLAWLQHRWGRPAVSVPDICQFGPYSIQKAPASTARSLVELLENHHWLRPISGGAAIRGK